MKIRLPDGREVEGEELDFETIKEVWNEYKLEDGTILKFKTIITSVIRTANRDPMTGDPVYHVRSTNIVRTKVPEKLKRLSKEKKPSGEEIA